MVNKIIFESHSHEFDCKCTDAHKQTPTLTQMHILINRSTLLLSFLSFLFLSSFLPSQLLFLSVSINCKSIFAPYYPPLLVSSRPVLWFDFPETWIASYHITSYHITSYPITSYHIISYHIISYHIISYHIISYHIISYHIISYHIISYHIISHQITSHRIISNQITSH